MSFDCPVCLEPFKDPRPCGHTFCFSCLSNMKPTNNPNGGLYSCPVCRREFLSVDNLSKNYVVDALMNESQKQQSLTPKEPHCENCESGSATLWCETCETFYCKNCYTTTHAPKALAKHQPITAQEKAKRPIFNKCPTHHKEDEFYCSDCKVQLCLICKEDNHQKHQTMSVYKYTADKRNALEACLAPFKNIEQFTSMEKKQRFAKEKDVAELKDAEDRVQSLKDRIAQHDADIEKSVGRIIKIQAEEKAFANCIKELGVMELLDDKIVDNIKEKIEAALREVDAEGKKQIQWLVCHTEDIPKYQTEGWKIVEFDELTEIWENFVANASSGIPTGGQLVPSNPLPHISKNGELGFFYAGTGPYVSSTVRREGDIVFHEHITLTPLSAHQLPSKHTHRAIEQRYIAIMLRRA